MRLIKDMPPKTAWKMRILNEKNKVPLNFNKKMYNELTKAEQILKFLKLKSIVRNL